MSSSQATDDLASAAEAGLDGFVAGLAAGAGAAARTTVSMRAELGDAAWGAVVGETFFGAALVTAVLLATFVAFDDAPSRPAGTTATDVRVGRCDERGDGGRGGPPGRVAERRRVARGPTAAAS